MCNESLVLTHRLPLAYHCFSPHVVLDVVVDDEVQLLIVEAVMFGKYAVDFVNDGF